MRGGEWYTLGERGETPIDRKWERQQNLYQRLRNSGFTMRHSLSSSALRAIVLAGVRSSFAAWLDVRCKASPWFGVVDFREGSCYAIRASTQNKKTFSADIMEVSMDDVEAVSAIVVILRQFEPDAQRRVLQSVHTLLDLPLQHKASSHSGDTMLPIRSVAGQEFSRDRSLSPKEFLRDKHPLTDVERVTCLAYYLAHYRDTPHFKTVDISTLNTEAAQPKFSNASVAVDNARASGYLVAATKGNKQISSAGERFVEVLPDREAAREAIRTFRPKRGSKRQKVAKNEQA